MDTGGATLDTAPRFGWLDRPDGVRLRTARWPVEDPSRGVVVLLNGRSEFVEKHQETADAFRRRGFDVVSFDWRNQGLSGGRPADNPQKHALDDFDRLTDDLDAFVDGVAAPNAAGPLVLFGHSMGGLVAALHLARRPNLYRAAILSAPMFDIVTDPWPRWLARALADAAVRAGFGDVYAFGQRDYDPAQDAPFRPDNPITSDPRRWAVFHDAFAARPELRLGGVTFGWVRAALRASDRVRRTVPLGAVATPVLVLSAPNDAIVNAAAHGEVARRFGDATLRVYPDARHEVLMERDPIRDRAWADIDAFLDRNPV